LFYFGFPIARRVTNSYNLTECLDDRVLISGVTDGGQRGESPPWLAICKSWAPIWLIFRFYYHFGFWYVVVFCIFRSTFWWFMVL